MGIFDIFNNKESDTLNDMSYIADIHHIRESWQQYDFLLAARGYGWDYIIDSAEYMINNDLSNISTVSLSKIMGSGEIELIDEYKMTGSIKQMKSLVTESGVLGIGGISKTIKVPVKIVWFNQTRVIRIFTTIDDEDLMLRYAETLIRRSFNTKNAMKKAKPVNK